MGVRTPLTLMAAVVMLASGAHPAVAQSEVEIEVSAGIGGYVDPTRPISVNVTIRAPLLVAGSIEIVHGGSPVTVPVEIPAGGSKTYTVIAPPPVSGQPARVRLYREGEDRALMSENLQLRSPEDRVLVGLVSAPDVKGALTDLRTEIGGLTIEPIELESAEGVLRPLAYLVVGDVDGVGGSVAGWVEDGGRVVGVKGTAERLGLQVRPLGAGPDGGGSWYQAGQGEVVEYPDLGDVRDWGRLIRPVPIALAPREIWQTPDRALANAASNGGQARAPSLPWLLAAIVGYAAVVGPVNFLILGRLRRRHLAWVTVPLLSLVAVGAFWLAGRSRLETEVVNHASVLVGGDDGQGRSAVVMATGKAGSHLLAFPPEWVAYPGQLGDFADAFGIPTATVAGEVGDDGIRFDLPQLGFAAVQTIHSPEGLPTAEVGLTDGTATIRVDNPTELEFWVWGVGSLSTTEVAPTSMAPGARGSLSVDVDRDVTQFGMNLGDAVVQARQLWEDERGWQVLYPLGEAAGYLGGFELFFFGFTDDYEIPIAVDARPRTVKGSTLVIVPIRMSDSLVAGQGWAPARLVSAGEAGWIERGPGFFFISTDEMIVSFRVPVGTDPSLEFNDMMGERPERFEAWDRLEHSFVPVSPGDPLVRERFVAPDGEVFVRARADDGSGAEFFPELPMAPSSLALSWEAA